MRTLLILLALAAPALACPPDGTTLDQLVSHHQQVLDRLDAVVETVTANADTLETVLDGVDRNRFVEYNVCIFKKGKFRCTNRVLLPRSPRTPQQPLPEQ